MNKYQFQYKAAARSTVPAIFAAEVVETAAESRPRVLMVGMHLSRTRGGITTLTKDILNSSLNEEYDFTYLASQAEDFGKIRKVLLALGAGIRLVGLCLSRNPALVYVHVGSNASLYRESVYIVLAKLLRRKALAHFHAGDVEDYYPKQTAVGRKFIQWAIGISDTVIAVSGESERKLRDLVPSTRVAMIPNAIDTSAFESSHERTPDNDRPVRLLFVGATGKLKGENDLIAALTIAKKANLNVKASLLGYGAERLVARCDRLGISGLIEHLGPVPMDERIAFYKQADIFILPTYAEAMPISIIEAMAAGLAIISTPVGGIAELIDDGIEGFLIQPGDVRALAEKIAFLTENSDSRLAMGKRARKRARREMNFKAYIKRLREEMITIRSI